MPKEKKQDEKTESEDIGYEESISEDQRPDSKALKRKKADTESKKKTAKRAKIDTEAASAANSESESDEAEDDTPVPLLDQSPEVTGTRIRKQVQRLSVNSPAATESPSRRKNEFSPGRGIKLGTSPKIAAQLQTVKQSEMTLLHRLLFKRRGTAHEIKRNVREFSGFWFSKEDKEFKNRKQTLEKQTLADIKFICQILALEKTGSKEVIAERLLDFLLCPELSLDPIKTPKSKKGTSKKAKGNLVKNVKSKDSNSETDPSSEEEESQSNKSIKKTPVTKKQKRKPIDSDSHESKESDQEESDKEEPIINEKKPARGRRAQKTPDKKVTKSRAKKRTHSESEVEETVSSDEEEATPKKSPQFQAKKATTRKTPKRQAKKKPVTPEKSSDSESEEEEEPKKAREAKNQSNKKLKKSVKKNQIISESEQESEDQSQDVPQKETPKRREKSQRIISDSQESQESNLSHPEEGETKEVERIPEKIPESENLESEKAESIKEEPTVVKSEEKENSSDPTDDQLKATIQEILKDADMETLTLKMLTQKVYTLYPNSNLEKTKKDFIRSTAKSLLLSSEQE